MLRQVWLTHPAVQDEPVCFECRWAELPTSHAAALSECCFAWDRIRADGEAERIRGATEPVYVPVLADVGCCLRAGVFVCACVCTCVRVSACASLRARTRRRAAAQNAKSCSSAVR